MAVTLPVHEITGTFETPGGDTVVAGRITAFLVPSGVSVTDMDNPATSPSIVLTSKQTGAVVNSSIQSLVLTALDSSNPSDAYYMMKFEMNDPSREEWYQTWRITGITTAAIDIGDLQPLSYGPYLPEAGYAPVQFVNDLSVTAITSLSMLEERVSDLSVTLGNVGRVYILKQGSSPSYIKTIGQDSSDTPVMIVLGSGE